jgi:hypothetical protein
MLELGGSFFIAMLKWVPCNWFDLQYLGEVILFEEVCGVVKVDKFSCISSCKRFWDLLNLTNIVFRAFVFFRCNVGWKFTVWMWHKFFVVFVFHPNIIDLEMHFRVNSREWWEALKISRTIWWLCVWDVVWVFL